jgi:hypothetical protein
MKLRLLPFLIFVCLLLIGCPSYSVHPLYTDQDAVVEPALEGTWGDANSDDKEAITFQKSGDYEYSMAVVDPRTKVKQTYKVHLVRLGNQLFMDLIFHDQTVNGAKLDSPIGAFPTHVIARVKISGDDLAYATLEDDAIRKQSTPGGALLDYQVADHGALLVTSQTEFLRRYVSAHTEEAFSNFEHSKRKGKTPVQP